MLKRVVPTAVHVDLRGWAGDFSDEWRTGNKFDAAMGAVQDLHNGLFFSLTSRYPIGTNVFDRDWDLLVVLDACRVDAMREVAPEYDFIDDVDSIWSVGSASHEWICKTYTRAHEETIGETMLISSNPWIPRTLKERTYPPGNYSVPVMWANWDVVEWDDLGMAWHVNANYERHNTPPPPAFVTDYAIQAGREHDFDRTIVHYMQPHIPHIAKAYDEDRPPTEIESDPWESIRSGTATRAEIWDQYLDNLRLVLDSIGVLLENLDAETVVITADHGDLIGEFGAYGHPAGFVHPNLKKVPWVTTTARDSRTVTPDVDLDRDVASEKITEQLQALGYAE